MCEKIYQFNEILKLKELLEKERVEFKFIERHKGYPVELYQIEICNPIDTRVKFFIVSQGHLSLGGTEDKLEIADFSFNRNDIYEGWLSAEDTLKRIKLALRLAEKEKTK